MALVNDAKKEIHAKIVYYGPGRSGKTTNLEFIYNKLKPEYRGKFKFMNTPSGRMVFFDFMRPELAAIKDFSIHFHIYTVPGDAVDATVWKNVLKGVDGLVFVADLESSRMLENRRSLDCLKEYLEAYGRHLEETPLIFQCNKRDVPGAITVDEIRNLLDVGDVPAIPASARSGEGVLPALSEMVKMVLQKLRDLPFAQEEETTPVPEESPSYAAVAHAEQSASLAAEPGTEPDEAELLIVEPVEEDVAYPQESEVTEPVAAEAMEPVISHGQAAMVAPVEVLDEKPQEPAEPEITVDAAFLAPSWGGVVEPEPAETETSFSDFEEVEGMEELDDADEAEIELEGAMEAMGNGRFRLPLVVRFRGKETRAALTLDVSLEKFDSL
jgi:signal recognition particle receptor subunit beta